MSIALSTLHTHICAIRVHPVGPSSFMIFQDIIIVRAISSRSMPGVRAPLIIIGSSHKIKYTRMFHVRQTINHQPLVLVMTYRSPEHFRALSPL